MAESEKLLKMRSEKRTLYRRKYIKSSGRKIRERMIWELSSYQFLLDKQNGLCAICFKKSNSGRALAIDHDHKTGEVRGLLCFRCNSGIGLFEDNTQILYQAIEYLKKGGK